MTPTRRRRRRYKWTLAALAGAVQSALYFGIGHPTFARSTELLRTRLDDAIPFWPWTSWCYLPFYAAIFIMAIAGFRRREMFNRALKAVALVMFLGALGHLFVRAEYPRPMLSPPYPDLSVTFMAWVQRVDRPGNVFPSLHVAQTSTLALLLCRDRPAAGARRAGHGGAAGAVDADHQAALHRRRDLGLRAGLHRVLLRAARVGRGRVARAPSLKAAADHLGAGRTG